MKKAHLFAFVGALALIVGGFNYVHRAPLETRIVDESAHVTQMQRIIKGQEPVERLTTLPGYHYISVGVFHVFDRIFDFEQLKTYHVRMIGVLYVALLFIVLTYLMACAAQSRWKAAVVLAIPVLSPYLFLAYTEVLSLVFVCVGLLFFVRGRYFFSGVAMLGSLCVRQDNIVWLLMLMSWSAWSCHARSKSEGVDSSRIISVRQVRALIAGFPLKRFVRENIWYGLSALLFVVFVLINGGVAVGDKRSHPISLNTENVFFFLILMGIIFLPTIVSYRWEIYRLVRRHLLISYVVALSLGSVYLLSFELTHSYNRNLRFLHNYLGTFFSETLLGIAFGIGLACAALAFLAVILTRSKFLARLHKRERRVYFLIVYLTTFISLVLHPLMEHRYYIIPMVLIVAFMSFKSRAWLWVQFVYMLSLSLTYYWIVFMKDFFK